MSSTMNLSLTNELKEFISQNSGDGTLYATPSEFVRDVLREKKHRFEAANLRDGVLEGYQDLMNGRYMEYQGSIRDVIQKVKAKNKKGW